MRKALQLAAGSTMLLSMATVGTGFFAPAMRPVRDTMLLHEKLRNYSTGPRRKRFLVKQLHLSDVPMESGMGDNHFDFANEINGASLTLDAESMKPTVDWDDVINTSVMAAVCAGIVLKFLTVDFGMMQGWTVSEMAYRIPMDNWHGYSAILESAPVATKAVTSASVYTLGDIISQKSQGKTNGELDRARILRNLLAGLIGHGPLSHMWYNFSEGLFENVLLWTAWWSFIPKVVLDQTIWGPIWNNTYILLVGLMRGDNVSNVASEMKRTTVPLIVAGLKLWPLAHCITYGLIPVENRLLWVDLVEILWVTILSTQANAGPHSGDTEGMEQGTEMPKLGNN